MSDEYSVIQDFDNKRANAHASLFVASMFGSFTILSLMDRLVTPNVFSSSNCAVFGLLLLTYVLVLVFGAYSLLNFFFYATTSQHAEVKIIGGKERELVSEAKKGWKGILKRFADFKVPEPKVKTSKEPEKKETRFKRNKEDILVSLYVLIALLPIFAFFIRFFCG